MRLPATIVVICCIYGGAGQPILPSPGCGSAIQFKQGITELLDMEVEDSQLGKYIREFALTVPRVANEIVPIPLLMVFHGQSGNAFNYATRSFPQVASLGETHGYASVFPQGYGDSDGLAFCGTGWNTGAKGDTKTCTSEADLFSCCYKSCRTLGICEGNFADAKCGWSTCYNDAEFTEQLIDHIGSKMCIDLNRVFVTGFSNGGMLTWYLSEKIPHRIAAFLPIYGLPLVGHLVVPMELEGKPFAFVSGRRDRVVPIDGSKSDQGWYYETSAESVIAVARINGCSDKSIKIETPFDGKNDFSCYEHQDCKSPTTKILECLYDGGHAPPSDGYIIEFVWWFFQDYVKRISETAEK